MGIDVRIKNGQLFKKALKIEDITLGKYEYGSTDEYWRNTGELIEGYNILHDPNHIGRGMEFKWSKNLKDEIELRVNFFSTRYDMEMFYEVIRNILHVWKVKSFEHDASVCTEADLDELCRIQKKFNLEQLAGIDQMDVTTIFGAMYPIDIDKDKVASFGKNQDEEGYAEYLHKLQCMDAYYAVPIIYKLNDTEFYGSYAITAGVDTIFPKEAHEPMMFKDPNTGEQLKCSLFVVTLVSFEKKCAVGRMAFDDFVEKAGVLNCPAQDIGRVFLKGLSEEKIAELAESEHLDPLAENN